MTGITTGYTTPPAQENAYRENPRPISLRARRPLAPLNTLPVSTPLRPLSLETIDELSQDVIKRIWDALGSDHQHILPCISTRCSATFMPQRVQALRITREKMSTNTPPSLFSLLNKHGKSVQELSIHPGVLNVQQFQDVINNCPNITRLNLSGQTTSGAITIEKIRSLIPLNTLYCLDLSGQTLSEEILKEVSRLTQLRDLRMIHCTQVTAVGLKALKALPHLKTLNLQETPLTDDCLTVLNTMQNLEVLALDDSFSRLLPTPYTELRTEKPTKRQLFF